jgi:hypothetical protein
MANVWMVIVACGSHAAVDEARPKARAQPKSIQGVESMDAEHPERVPRVGSDYAEAISTPAWAVLATSLDVCTNMIYAAWPHAVVLLQPSVPTACEGSGARVTYGCQEQQAPRAGLRCELATPLSACTNMIYDPGGHFRP